MKHGPEGEPNRIPNTIDPVARHIGAAFNFGMLIIRGETGEPPLRPPDEDAPIRCQPTPTSGGGGYALQVSRS